MTLPNVPAFSIQVVKSHALREGIFYATAHPRRMIVGSRKPTEYEAIVMDGFAKAHPWFKDPLRAGAEAWRIIEKTAKEQGYGINTRRPNAL